MSNEHMSFSLDNVGGQNWKWDKWAERDWETAIKECILWKIDELGQLVRQSKELLLQKAKLASLGIGFISWILYAATILLESW